MWARPAHTPEPGVWSVGPAGLRCSSDELLLVREVSLPCNGNLEGPFPECLRCVYRFSVFSGPMYQSILSAETLKVRRERQDIFKVLKGKNLQPKLLYSERISFKIDGEIKSFSDKQKLSEFSTIKPAILKGLIWSRNTREEKKI